MKLFYRRRRRERELAEETESYIEYETERNVARGMSAAEARDAARRKFGNRAMIREAVHEMYTIRLVEMAGQDLKYGLRQLRLNPGFALTAILSLAFGVGANTAIFQLVDAVRLRSLPVERPQELVEVKPADGSPGFGLYDGFPGHATFPMWEQIRDGQKAFSDVFAWTSTDVGIGKGAQQIQKNAFVVTGDAFRTLGMTAYRGRLIGAEDDKAGCGVGPVVISHALWQKDFAGRNDVIGAKLIVNDQPFTIVGVTPPSFFGLEVGKSFDVSFPLCAMAIWKYPIERKDMWWLGIVGRLKPNWTVERAAEHMKALTPGIMEAAAPTGYAAEAMKNWRRIRLTAEPGGAGVSRLREAYESSLWLLMGITGLVLLIACANLANLLLARAGSREREMAVRLSIGASRIRLASQLFSESVILAAFGGMLGAGLAVGLSRMLIHFISSDRDLVQLNLNADWRMWAFTIGCAFGTCVLFGLAPALRSTQVDAAAAMKAGGGRGNTADRNRFGFQQALIASQVAVSMVLVTGALLFVTSFRKLTAVDAGIRQEGLINSYAGFGRLGLPKEKVLAFQDRLLEAVRAIPGIQSASTTTHTPLSGMSWTLGIRVPGFEGRGKKWSKFTWSRPRYFETIGVRMIAGRDFNDFDTATSRPVIVINETFARQVFGTSNPIGQAVISEAEPGYPETAYEITGVVSDAKYGSLRDEVPPESFAPAVQNPRIIPWVAIVSRTAMPSAAAVSAIQRAIASVNPDVVVENEVVREVVEGGLVRERTLAWLSGFFGALAALLAMIGLYGVISYMVAKRRSEIGIRLALGAGRGGIVRLILRQVAMLLLIGLTVGVALSLLISRSVESLLFGMAGRDPFVLMVAALGLTIVAGAACLMPAMQASRVDPMDALRQE